MSAMTAGDGGESGGNDAVRLQVGYDGSRL
jgi:hypothetical protein